MKDVLLMLANAVNPKRSLGHWSGSLKKADGRKQMVPANGKINQSISGLPLTRCVALDQSFPHDVFRSSLCSGVEGLPCTVTVKQDLNVRVLLKL